MSLTKIKRRGPFLQSGWPTLLEANELFSDEFFNKNCETPAMNFKDLEERIEIELAMPGFSKDQIQVTLENDQLHVIAEKEQETVEENQEGNSRKEFSSRLMERYIPMPTSVDQDAEISANYENGLLKIELKKLQLPEAGQVKKVKIN